MRTPVLATTAAGIMLVTGCSAPESPAAVAIALQKDHCTAGELKASAGDGDMYSEAGEYFENVRLTFRNTSAAACAVDGHLRVELAGPATGAFRPVFPLPATGAPARVILEPGETGHATIRVHVLPGADDLWQPTGLTVRLPGDDTPARLPWPDGLAITQDTTPLPAAGPPNSVQAVTSGG
jgi:hypothetical protein